MGDRKLAVVIGIALSICIFFIYWTRKVRLTTEEYVENQRPTQSTTKTPKKTERKPLAWSSGGSPVNLANEYAEAEAVRIEHQAKMAKEGKQWLDEFLKDTSISTYTREIYRMRNNQNILAGYAAYNNKNYFSAKEEFAKVFDDLNQAPSVKFVACEYLMNIAREEKRPEDYFKWGKEMGELIAKNDLSVFHKKPHSNEFLETIKEKELLFKARGNPGMQAEIANYLLERYKSSKNEIASEWAMNEVKARIKRVEEEVQN